MKMFMLMINDCHLLSSVLLVLIFKDVDACNFCVSEITI